MKNKGFTLIELILSLSLIVLVILPVFGVIMGYKNKEIIEANKADLNSFKSKVITTIEEDIVKKGIKYTCEYIEKDVNDRYFTLDTKQRLMFQDNTYADLEINYEQKSISYITYKEDGTKINTNTFVIPVSDATLEDASYIKDKTANPDYNYFYISDSINLKKYTDKEDLEDNKATILKIFIPITYEDTDYSIAITSTFEYDSQESPLCGENNTDGNYCPYSNNDSYKVTDGIFTCTNNFLG